MDKNAKRFGRLKIHAILGTKGGVGKSSLAVHLADWMEQRQLPYSAYDLDEENSTFNRFNSKAACLNTRDREQADLLVMRAEELAGEHKTAALILDLRAGSGDEMLAWFAEVPFDYLREKGIDFVGWGCVTSDPDSQQTVARWLERLESGLQASCIVKNLKDGNFAYVEPVIKPPILRTITIPQIESRLMARINEQAMPLSGILKIQDNIKGLTDTMMRARISRLQKEIFAQFDAQKDILVDHPSA